MSSGNTPFLLRVLIIKTGIGLARLGKFAWLGSANRLGMAWLGLAGARLYYTAPYRVGIDVSCTCPLVHWLGLGLAWAWLGLGLGLARFGSANSLGSVRPRLNIKYTSSAPYDITQLVCITIPYRRLPDRIKDVLLVGQGTTLSSSNTPLFVFLCVFIDKAWCGWLFCLAHVSLVCYFVSLGCQGNVPL